MLNEFNMFSACRDLGIYLINKNITGFFFMQTIADAYQGLGDRENAIKYYSETYKYGPGHSGINKIIDSLGIDKQSLVPRVNLSTKELELLTGDYMNSNNGNIVSISYAKDTISFATPWDSGKLIPMARDKAYFINRPSTIKFYFTGSKGDPASYFIRRYGDGNTLKFTRKDPAE